jgi:hypothetical protein
MPIERAVNARQMSLKERVLLNALVAESGCWEWQGYIDKHGYGKITIDGYPSLAHRASWQSCFGDINDGLLVCHKCDNRKCVNPNHLFLGTPKENSLDMFAKGRAPVVIGERHGSAKLTENQVIDIRRRYKAGAVQRTLAKEYGVNPMAINKIVHNKTWRHI